MTTGTIQERIDALDPDQINWNDASAYAAMGIGQDDASGEQDQGDSDTPQTAASAPAPAPTQSSQAPEAAPAINTEPAGAVEGIATADGKRIIPYAVLQGTRRELLQANERAAAAEAALAEAAAKAVRAGAGDLAERAAADPDSLTDEEMADLAEDFPSLVKPLKIISNLAKQSTTPSPAPVAAPASVGRAAKESDEHESFDEGIAANPLLASWMGKGGREWSRAVAVDRVLEADPDYAHLTYTQRFAKVQRMVAAEFDIALPSAPPAAPLAASPAAAPLPKPKASAYPSLSDIGGTTPLSEDDSINSASSTDLLAAAERMTDTQLMRMAGVSF